MRYLLLEFDDNESADRMREKIDEATEAGKGFRVAGLFAVPTAWCTCPKDNDYKGNDIVRGAKLGWWVHRLCRKARHGTHELVNLIHPKDRYHGKETGYVQLVHSVTVGEIPAQNIAE